MRSDNGLCFLQNLPTLHVSFSSGTKNGKFYDGGGAGHISTGEKLSVWKQKLLSFFLLGVKWETGDKKILFWIHNHLFNPSQKIISFVVKISWKKSVHWRDLHRTVEIHGTTATTFPHIVSWYRALQTLKCHWICISCLRSEERPEYIGIQKKKDGRFSPREALYWTESKKTEGESKKGGLHNSKKNSSEILPCTPLMMCYEKLGSFVGFSRFPDLRIQLESRKSNFFGFH